MNTKNYYLEKIDLSSSWISPVQPAIDTSFYVLEAGHFFAQQDYRVARDSLDSYLLLYTISGRGHVISGDTATDLPPQQAIIIDCRRPHQYFCAEEAWEFYWVHFDGSGVPALYNILYPVRPQAISIIDPADFSRQLGNVFSLMQAPDTSSSITLSVQLHQLLASLYSAGSGALEPQHSRYVRLAIDYIQANYQEPISIDDMLTDVPLSKYYFIRVFKTITGATPYNYLTSYRVSMARHLLVEGERSIEEIGQLCGFPDTGSFIRHFKAHTRQTPLQYRKWMRFDNIK